MIWLFGKFPNAVFLDGFGKIRLTFLICFQYNRDGKTSKCPYIDNDLEKRIDCDDRTNRGKKAATTVVK
ncbi:MAG: hypothetical protein IJV16_00940 [Lachnospiraceae bacterium]|nr:hypothetical protein [Lachnospiraceae bacterium]